MPLHGCCPINWKGKKKETDDFPAGDEYIEKVKQPVLAVVEKLLKPDLCCRQIRESIKISDTLPIGTSLNTFIRSHAHLPGTKFMCLEGGCGACIVSITGIHAVLKKTTTWAVNSCLFPIFSCHELEITTIEGLGSKKAGYHPLQKTLSKFNGTQCGYCSPGQIMNMHSLLEHTEGQLRMEDIENSFGGNMCRCTGYRPILDAFKSVALDATEDLKKVVKDIEDLDKICSKTGQACSGKCDTAKNNFTIHLSDEDEKEWYKFNTVQEILDLFKTLANTPDKKYMLVHGNTAHGVYRRDPNIEVFIDVTDVDALHMNNIGDEIELGGNVSLTETMRILTQAAETRPDFEYCRTMVKHIDLVANVPVRNVGTLAGNLSIKHEHNEFPSDIFLLLETVGAKLLIIDRNGKTKQLKPIEFLEYPMKYKIITKISLPALKMGKLIFKSYKIMPRAQNAHAYVNAGFLFELDENEKKIENATVVYGGIRPDFIHACGLEHCLKENNTFSNDMLQAGVNVLESELHPDWVLPDASADYRKNLAKALFYKAILSMVPNEMVGPKNKTGAEILTRTLSSGRQDFDTKPDEYPLTQAIPKIEGLIQCSGEAEYINDIPTQTNELWAAFVLARVVGSKIIKIDPSEALKLKGVQYFYSAKDIPGKNNFMPNGMAFVEEAEEIFCAGKVKYNGQPCGIVLADTFELANQAAELVKITYGARVDKEICPTIRDVFKFKDFNGAKSTATNISDNHDINIKNSFDMAGQYHYSMETQACVTIPNDEGLNVYAATQWMDLTHVAVAQMLNVPLNSVNVYTKRLGGAYGVKISRATLIACACTLGAYLTNRPVRFIMKLESNMEAIGKRFGARANYEVDIDTNGKIKKLHTKCSQDYGCSRNEPVLGATEGYFGNCYDKSKWTFEGEVVLTDAAHNTWCRSPGFCEGIAISENILEHIAHVVKRDPTQVRLDNMPQDSTMREIMHNFLISVDYENRKKSIEDFNNTNRWVKRGISVVPMKYPFDYGGTFHALVSIYHGDGTVAVTHGGIEMGQGINTKAAQVAAHILGINLDMVIIKKSNNLTSANDFVTGGSIGSDSVSFAVKKGCEELVTRLKPIKDKNPGLMWPELIKKAYSENVDLTASVMFKPDEVKGYIIWGVSCAEIEVDVLTGNYILTRVDILEDVGRSISPEIDVGQIEGAFIMGMGYWLMELLVYDNSNGKLMTDRTWNYKIPGAKDIPVDFRVNFLRNAPNPFGVLRSKATGEPALCMSIVVLFALRQAINSARKDAGLGDNWYHAGAPTTVSDIFLLCGSDKTEQFNLN